MSHPLIAALSLSLGIRSRVSRWLRIRIGKAALVLTLTIVGILPSVFADEVEKPLPPTATFFSPTGLATRFGCRSTKCLCRCSRRLGGDSRHEVLQVALARDLPQQTTRLPKVSVRRARLEILDMVFSKDIVQLQTLRSPTISRAEEASKPENT